MMRFARVIAVFSATLPTGINAFVPTQSDWLGYLTSPFGCCCQRVIELGDQAKNEKGKDIPGQFDIKNKGWAFCLGCGGEATDGKKGTKINTGQYWRNIKDAFTCNKNGQVSLGRSPEIYVLLPVVLLGLVGAGVCCAMNHHHNTDENPGENDIVPGIEESSESTTEEGPQTPQTPGKKPASEHGKRPGTKQSQDESTDESEGCPTLILVLVAAGLVVCIGGAAYMLCFAEDDDEEGDDEDGDAEEEE